MQRREFVRAVLTIGVTPRLLLAQQATPAPPPPAPVPWLLGLNPHTPLPHVEVAEEIAASDLRFFTPLQMETLSRLADVLVPPLNGKPGALQAQVPAFLDFFIGSSPDTQRQVYTGGLDWLDSESQKKHNTLFAKLEDAQAGALLSPWLRTWMNDHPPAELHADFINIAHDDIRKATLNSRAWFEAVPPPTAPDPYNPTLYWYPIEPDLTPNTAAGTNLSPHVQAVPKSNHTMPTYPR